MYQLANLAQLLEAKLVDGDISEADIIEALTGVKGFGEWSIEQTSALCATGSCSYLVTLRSRASS